MYDVVHVYENLLLRVLLQYVVINFPKTILNHENVQQYIVIKN